MDKQQEMIFPVWERKPQFTVDIVNSISILGDLKEAWSRTTSDNITIIQVRDVSRKSNFGDITHLIVQKEKRSGMRNKDGLTILDFLQPENNGEPNYSEKVEIINTIIDRKNIIAMEVFPSQANLIDGADIYHIWVADKAKFPFIDLEATEPPKGKEWESSSIEGLDIEYMVRTTGSKLDKVAYFYIRRQDGQELVWREKQMLKNELQYEGMTAIEIISECSIGKPTCLVFLPLSKSLDFGLHIL